MVGQHTGAAPGRARFARRTAGGRTAFISYRHSLAVARQATALDNIDRIPAPSPADLDRLYVRTGTPVVLTGCSAAPPPAAWPTRPAPGPTSGTWSCPAAAHPVDAAVQGRRPGPARPTSLAALVDALAAPARGAGDRRVCVEHPTPDQLAAALPPPAYVELGEARDPWLSSMFLAGEALLIPAACWHYVEYLEVALSVGFRLRRNAWLARLATRVPVPGADIPALAARVRDDGAVTPAARRAYELRVRPARRRPAPAWW